jgi:hypothetical protein
METSTLIAATDVKPCETFRLAHGGKQKAAVSPATNVCYLGCWTVPVAFSLTRVTPTASRMAPTTVAKLSVHVKDELRTQGEIILAHVLGLASKTRITRSVVFVHPLRMRHWEALMGSHWAKAIAAQLRFEIGDPEITCSDFVDPGSIDTRPI